MYSPVSVCVELLITRASLAPPFSLRLKSLSPSHSEPLVVAVAEFVNTAVSVPVEDSEPETTIPAVSSKELNHVYESSFIA